MPTEAIEIREVERAVSRPIAMDVIRELFPRWRIPASAAKVLMPGDTETIPMTHSSLHVEEKPHRLFNDLAARIELEENYVEYGAAYQPYKEKEWPPIFLDRDLRIGIRPVYREVQAEIAVTIEAKSRTHANQIAKRMQAEMRSYSQYDHHEVEYHYQIQPEIIWLLKRLWELRDNNFSHHDTFSEWFNKCIDNRVTTNYNHGNKGHQIAVRESQVSITGYYDFSEPPVSDKNETGMKYSYTFRYKYTYMRPEHLIIYYPIAIHNQMLPDDLIDKEKVLDAKDFYGIIGWSHRYLSDLKYGKGKENLEQRTGLVTIPHYDDWDNYLFSASFTPMIKALLYFNPTEPTSIIKLDDMGSWRLKENALNYIRRRANGNFRPFDSIFQFSLHEWEKMRDWRLLTLDSDLTIRFSGERDGRNNYHLITSLVNDPSRLSADAIRDLLLYGELAIDYLDILYPGIRDQFGPGGIFTLNPDGSLSWDDWNTIIGVIRGLLKKSHSRDRVFASIITYHEGDIAT